MFDTRLCSRFASDLAWQLGLWPASPFRLMPFLSLLLKFSRMLGQGSFTRVLARTSLHSCSTTQLAGSRDSCSCWRCGLCPELRCCMGGSPVGPSPAQPRAAARGSGSLCCPGPGIPAQTPRLLTRAGGRPRSDLAHLQFE